MSIIKQYTYLLEKTGIQPFEQTIVSIDKSHADIEINRYCKEQNLKLISFVSIKEYCSNGFIEPCNCAMH